MKKIMVPARPQRRVDPAFKETAPLFPEAAPGLLADGDPAAGTEPPVEPPIVGGVADPGVVDPGVNEPGLAAPGAAEPGIEEVVPGSGFASLGMEDGSSEGAESAGVPVDTGGSELSVESDSPSRVTEPIWKPAA